MRRALAPLLGGLLGLAGALGATFSLHHAAEAALERVLEERLRGAGETAGGLLEAVRTTPERLRAVMRSNGLEGAYLLSPGLEVLADATGPSGGRVDLLRIDQTRLRRALAGESSVAVTFAVGDQPIATGYFPVRARDGAIAAVLALEAGQEFAAARRDLRRALLMGVALSALAALALAAAAFRWARSEAARHEAAERAARGDALARMAAMVAHEVRNPLGIIRGAAELVEARGGAALAPPDREALRDVLGEVERLTRLTEDFMDLAREPALDLVAVDAAGLAQEAARGLARSHPSVAVRIEVPPLAVAADPRRLRQVLANLLLNAAQAGARTVEVRGAAGDGVARLVVRDDGPGLPPDLRRRLFEPFATGRAEGTGLGLAVSRRIAERHGGTLALLEDGGPGAAFELSLPLAPG